MKKNNYIEFEDYVKDFGKQENPIEFINWISEKNYTLEIWRELFRNKETHIEFHGNLVEESCPFKYDIYNDEMVGKLKELIINNKIRCVFVQIH